MKSRCDRPPSHPRDRRWSARRARLLWLPASHAPRLGGLRWQLLKRAESPPRGLVAPDTHALHRLLDESIFREQEEVPYIHVEFLCQPRKYGEGGKTLAALDPAQVPFTSELGTPRKRFLSQAPLATKCRDAGAEKLREVWLLPRHASTVRVGRVAKVACQATLCYRP